MDCLALPEQSLRERHGAKLMAASPVYFAAKTLSGPPEPPYNGRFLPGPHHLEWDRLVTQHDRVCILASRGLGKTFFFSEAYAIWRAIYRPGKLTFILSAASAQAEEVLQHIKDEVETNPKLRWLLPSRAARKGSSWNKSQVIFSNGSRIVTAGFGTKKRGLHPDCILVDDGLTDESAYSPTVRRKQNNYFFSAITNMLNPGGIIIVVGTPFSSKDLYGELSRNSAYTYRVFPAIKNGVPLFPKRFDLAYLKAKREEIGTIRFGQEIECVPMSDEMSLFPKHLFQHERMELKQLTLGMPYEFWSDAGIDLFMGVDFALSSGVGADYMIIFIMGCDAQGNRYWVDIERHKGLPYQQQLSLINKMARKYEVQLAVLEANQAQRIFGDELIDQTDLPIKKYNTGVEKHSLEKGIPSLRVLLENKKMRIPRGDRRSVELTDIVIDEFHNWTYVDGKLENVGEHDDTSMACIGSQAIITTISGGVPIEKICPGDIVLTHRGQWRKVTGVMKRLYSGTAFRMRASGRASFLITPEHPVYTAQPRLTAQTNRLLPDDDTWDFVPASQVRSGRKLLGDYALIPFPKWEPAPTKIDLSLFVDFSRSPKGGNCWKVTANEIWWRADRKVSRYLTIDAEMAFVIGLYLAEGSVGGGGRSTREGGRSKSHIVAFGLNARETYLSDFLERVFYQRFHAISHVLTRTEDNGMQFAAASVPAAGFFRQLRKGVEKGLPDSWMGWPIELRKWLVRGWLCGDGSLSKRSNGHIIRGVSISPRLVDQLRWCLQDLGLSPTVAPHENSKAGFGLGRSKPAWSIALNGQDTAILLQDLRPEEEIRWSNAVFCPSRPFTNKRSTAHESGLAVRIAELTPEHYEGLVYNFEVEGDESYVVEGIAVHNCWLANIAVKSGGFSASFGTDETRAALQAGGDTLKAAAVPEEPVQLALEAVEEGEVSYDMFGNPVYGEDAELGDPHGF